MYLIIIIVKRLSKIFIVKIVKRCQRRYIKKSNKAYCIVLYKFFPLYVPCLAARKNKMAQTCGGPVVNHSKHCRAIPVVLTAGRKTIVKWRLTLTCKLSLLAARFIWKKKQLSGREVCLERSTRSNVNLFWISIQLEGNGFVRFF